MFPPVASLSVLRKPLLYLNVGQPWSIGVCQANQYNGFNLILADVNSGTMVYISNRPGGVPVIQIVAPGLHVLSNAAIDSPWPKVRHTGIL